MPARYAWYDAPAIGTGTSDGVAACVGGAGVRTLDAGCGRSVGGTSGGKEAASGRVAGGIEGIGVPSAV